VAGIILGVLALAAVGGLVLLVLWIGEPSASASARSHVQRLFLVGGSKRTGTVTGCIDRGPARRSSLDVWACRVIGTSCVHTFAFVMIPGYGAAPYDRRSGDGLTDPCSARSAPTLPSGLKR
jgi:hypothetical protein